MITPSPRARFAVLATLALACLAASTFAQPVLITSPTTINAGDATVGGVPLATAQVTVQGTTLTINGAVSIASLVLQRSAANAPGVLTHVAGGTAPPGGGERLGLALTVTGAMTIQGASGALVQSRIDVAGMGLPSDTGPGRGFGGGDQWGGGAGHGGNGAFGQNANNAFPGSAYGDLLRPVSLGSGGGADIPITLPGGAGGGAVRLVVGGTLTCDGAITADGVSGSTFSGGGSGGSVWISAATFAGSGTISAGGGPGVSNGGGGGGGRIAVYAAARPFTGVMSAAGAPGGGGGTTYAAPGPIVFGAAPDARPNVSISQSATASTSTTPLPASLTVGDLTLELRAAVDFSPGAVFALDATTLTLSGNASIRADSMSLTAGTIQVLDASALSVLGRGFGHNAGPGSGSGGANDWGGGGGHGGRGGRGQGMGPTPLGGQPYGDFAHPTTAGSGGGDNDLPRHGGPGGGVLRINAGAIVLAGTIDARGAVGADYAGGGAGGSVWITAGSLNGTGSVLAGGAGSVTGGGGGSGGRIAVESPASPTITLDASGGVSLGGQHGAAGSVYRRAPGSVRGQLTFDNAGRSGATDVFENGSIIDADVRIVNKAQFEFATPGDVNQLAVVGSLTVGSGTTLSADAFGFPSDTGPGHGSGGSNNWGGGGGYGGRGGQGLGGPILAPGGHAYGSLTQPVDLGSGGGQNDPPRIGGTGGGAIRLDVGGTFTLDGAISANGTPGASYAGGGSGGSIYLVTSALVGSGAISARGGDANNDGGGGGGGRVAIYACGRTFPLANINVQGGAGFENGQPGTLFLGGSSITITTQPADQTFQYNDAIVQLSVTASTSNAGGLAYQWRQRDATGEFVPLTEGQDGRYVDVHSPILTIVNLTCAQDAQYDCVVTDSCGPFPSRIARLSIGRRIGDYDGSGGTPDTTDIVLFFNDWLAGDPAADVDNSGGTPDLTDITVFFQAWLEGC